MSVTLHQGDAREVLKRLPAESVQVCVTSPPYLGLRSYLPDGHPDKAREIGLEQSPAEFVAAMVEVFREIRRVLRPDGTAWLNLGDSYASDTKGSGGSGKSGLMRDGRPESGRQSSDAANARALFAPRRIDHGLKPKDLMMIPNRVVIALQDDGWWVRSEIVWHKRAPMPESVRDRPTCAHEKVWLLTKAARYFYDAEAVAEPASENKPWSASTNGGDKIAFRGDRGALGKPADGTRNLRNVWTLAPEPSSLAHFAMMPTRLAETCIKAGSSEKGQCPHCGSPWVRNVSAGPEKPGIERGKHPSDYRSTGQPQRHANGGLGTRERVTTGWSPSCSCPPHEPVPQTVLDPFSGAGTTLLVADRLQRHAVGVELNPDNCRLIRDRLAGDAPLFAEVA